MSVNCPKCGAKQPVLRWPTSWRQAMWGGWTCQKCGCEMDSHGKEITGEHTPRESALSQFREYFRSRVQAESQSTAQQSVTVHMESEYGVGARFV